MTATQLSLFSDQPSSMPPVAACTPGMADKHVRYPYWREDPVRKAGAREQLFKEDVPAVVRYGSGASAKWDALGYILVKQPLGVAATALGQEVIGYLTRYLDNGGRVFVDSGAFGAYRRGKDLDFEKKVFNVYDALVEGTSSPEGLLLVMPDKLNDQAATIELQRKYASRIRTWAGRGAEVMFPIHSGSDHPISAYEEIASMMRELPFAVGIPCVVSAWSASEIVAFCREAKPRRIHLLGLGREDVLQNLSNEVYAVSPQTRITADSCMLVAHAGVGRRLTDRSRTRLEAAALEVEKGISGRDLDDLPTFEVDVLDTPGFLNEAQAVALAEALGCEGPSWAAGFVEASKHGFRELLWHLYEDSNEEDGIEAFSVAVRDAVYRPWVRSMLRGAIRAYEVARLALNGDPELAEQICATSALSYIH